jgi:hypothetical protein
MGSENNGDVEAISKLEKWFEVKPPARRAYAPEGTAQDRKESRPRVGTSPAVLLKIFFSRTAAVREDGRTHRDRAIWQF